MACSSRSQFLNSQPLSALHTSWYALAFFDELPRGSLRAYKLAESEWVGSRATSGQPAGPSARGPRLDALVELSLQGLVRPVDKAPVDRTVGTTVHRVDHAGRPRRRTRQRYDRPFPAPVEESES